MKANFDRSVYYSLFTRKAGFSETTLVDHVKSHPRFSYDKVNYQQFSPHHKTQGSIGRKIIAIPAMLFTAIIKTIYHLVIALFAGIPLSFSDRGRCLKAQFFSLGRDFEESFGWFLTLFNDRVGSFFVQESNFYKTCYQNFAFKDTRPKPIQQPPSASTHVRAETTQRNTTRSEDDNTSYEKEKADALQKVKANANHFIMLPQKMKDDREIALEAVKKDHIIFMFLPVHLRNDPEIKAVQKTTEDKYHATLFKPTFANSNYNSTYQVPRAEPFTYRTPPRKPPQAQATPSRSSFANTYAWASPGFGYQTRAGADSVFSDIFGPFFGGTTFNNGYTQANFGNTRTNQHFRAPPRPVEKKVWSCPDELKGDEDEFHKIARRILKEECECYNDLVDYFITDLDQFQKLPENERKLRSKPILCRMLDIPSTSDDQAMKRAHKLLAMKLHPDKCSHKFAQLTFQALQSFYDLYFK